MAEKILLVEDEEKLARMVEMELRYEGYQVTKAFDSINVVAEQYPDLKANANFMALQNQITEVEEHLQASRRVYNSNVSQYNQDIKIFPSSIVANHLRCEPREFFEAEEAKRQDVKIEF